MKAKSAKILRPDLLQEVKDRAGKTKDQEAVDYALEFTAKVLAIGPGLVITTTEKVNAAMRARTFEVAVQNAALIAKHFGLDSEVTGDKETESIAIHSGDKTLVIAPPTASRGVN